MGRAVGSLPIAYRLLPITYRLVSRLPLLFRRTLDLHETTFAMGESIAHLHKLWFDGKLHRRQGGDGVYRFASV